LSERRADLAVQPDLAAVDGDVDADSVKIRIVGDQLEHLAVDRLVAARLGELGVGLASRLDQGAGEFEVGVLGTVDATAVERRVGAVTVVGGVRPGEHALVADRPLGLEARALRVVAGGPEPVVLVVDAEVAGRGGPQDGSGGSEVRVVRGCRLKSRHDVPIL
jgi:hypothetical protein